MLFTQSCFIVTQSLCVASPFKVWIHRSSADFQGGFFVFRDPQKRLKKNVLGPIRFGACFFWLFHSVQALFLQRFAS